MNRMSRRDLLRSTAAAGSAALVSWLVPRTAQGADPARGSDPIAPELPAVNTYSYFNAAEIAFVDAAVDRLIPSDQLGPGAKQAGVTFFIDQQLQGSFGRAETWYMLGPWRDGTPQQGYQLKMTPAQLYRAAIRATDDYCRQNYRKTFAQLQPGQQDKVLQGLEKGDIELNGASAKEFFNLLLQNTGEGFFADPLYGGNRDFAGWKLVGFPGPRYNYVNEITEYGKPYLLPTVGLLGRDGTPRRKA
jgi:gluconate 2-dehydrogenase gamma chain